MIQAVGKEGKWYLNEHRRYVLQKMHWVQRIKVWFSQLAEPKQETLREEPVLYRENLYLPQIREIIEQILEQKCISYGEFSPLIIDGSDSRKSIDAIKALSEDLNYLTVFTEMPAYFMEIAENMYEEHGLIVEIFPKTDTIKILSLNQKRMCHVILDFEQPCEAERLYSFGETIYIPIFKRPWKVINEQKQMMHNAMSFLQGEPEWIEESQERAGNLDIAVPIGYNTVIVSIGEAEQKCPCLDKFERAFWLEDMENFSVSNKKLNKEGERG